MPSFFKPFTLLLLCLMFCCFAQAQDTGYSAFINPGLQKDVADMKVNEQRKLLGLVEIGGNIHVYDIRGRKLLYFSSKNEQEISEGGTHQQYFKNLLQFNADGSMLGVFTPENGFRLYETSTWKVIIEIAWPGINSNNLDEAATPYDIQFTGNTLYVQFQSEKMSNNAFLFDTKEKKLIALHGEKGFYNDIEINVYNNGKIYINPDPPRDAQEVSITAEGKKIGFTKVNLRKHEPVLLTETGVQNVDDVETEEQGVVNTTALNIDADDITTKRLRAAIKQNNDWRGFFGRDMKAEELYAIIDQQNFTLNRSDTLGRYVLNNYLIKDSGLSVLEVSSEAHAGLQHFLQWQNPRKYRFNNIYLVNAAERGETEFSRQSKLIILSAGDNGMKTVQSFTSGEGYDILQGVVASPSGKFIAFGLNTYKSVEIHSFNTETRQSRRLAIIPRKKIDSWWIREDDMPGSARSLSVYTFLSDGYFFIRGKYINTESQLFETAHWSKLLDITNTGNTKSGIAPRPANSIFTTGDSLLIDNTTVWNYKQNKIQPVKPAAEDGDPDFENVFPLDYSNINQNFLKTLKLNFNKQTQRLEIGNGSYITGRKDKNNRLLLTHHEQGMSLEYYPALSWTTVSDLVVPNPNFYTDNELSGHVRFVNKKGKKIILRSPYGPSQGGIKGAFSADGAYIFTLGGYNYIDIWDSTNGGYLATIIPYFNNEFIIIDKNQHYYTTDPALLKYLYIKYKGVVYPAEELDVYQHRPDIIMQALKFIDNPQLLQFYQVWTKQRRQNAGITTDDNSNRPTVTIQTGKLPLATGSSQLTLTAAAQGPAKPVKAYLWCNNIKTDSTSAINDNGSFSFTPTLQQGSNKLQVAVIDAAGVQSFRQTVYVNYMPNDEGRGRTYGAVMGVSTYDKPEYNLKYSVKDAKDLSAKLTYLGNGEIINFFNADVNAANVGKVTGTLQNSAIDDLAIIYLSGHGALDDKGQFYFCTANTSLDNPATNGISMQQLQALFNNVKARKRLLILDACHSGNTEMLKMEQAKTDTLPAMQGLVARGMKARKSSKALVSASNYAEMLKQQLLNLNSFNGVQIFAATSGAGLAYESEKWNNGIFTLSMIQALTDNAADDNKDRRITLSELVDFVAEQVKQQTGGRQLPEAGVISWDKNWVFLQN